MAKKNLFFICAFILFSIINSWSKDNEEITAYELNPVVITAQRIESKKSDVPQTIEIITKDDIKKFTASTLDDILVKKTNIDIIKYPGVLSTVNLRGFTPDFMTETLHYSLLIDGRNSGITNLSTILLQNVEKIEILKGPASSLYGAEAMAGVINIITKKNSGKIKTNFNSQVGNFNSQVELTSGGSIKNFNFDISFANITQNNYKVPKFTVGNFNWNEGVWKENSFNNLNNALRLGYDINKNHNLNLKYEIFTGKDIKSAGSIFKNEPAKKDLYHNSVEFSYKGKTEKNNWLIKVFTIKNKNNNLTFDDKLNKYYKSLLKFTDYIGIQTQNTIFMSNNELTFGIDYNQNKNVSERYESNGNRISPYEPDNGKENWALFAENKLSFFEKKLITTLGARYDNYNLKTLETPYFTNIKTKAGKENINSFNPRSGIVYHLTNTIRFHTSIGTAFIVPNPNQKAGYYYDTSKKQIVKGNPNIKPENSLSYDTGCEFTNSLLNMDITYFHTNIKDKIEKIEINKTEATFENITKSEIIGIENTLSFNLGKIFNIAQQIEVYSNLTYLLKAKNITINKDIYRVAKIKLNYGIEYNDEKLNGNLYFRHLGKIKETNRYSEIYVNQSEIEYGNFTIANLSLLYKITKNMNINLKAENLFNKIYQEKPGYPMPGRSISTGINIGF
ncbi:MAG: TonB-dependent receptor [bacterium]